MSPVDQVDSVTEMNGSYEKFEIGFRDEKRPEILGTSVLLLNTRNISNMAKHKNFNFHA